MPLSDKLVREFKEIYQDRTGKEIDFETASKYAEDVAEVFYVMAEISSREKS